MMYTVFHNEVCCSLSIVVVRTEEVVSQTIQTKIIYHLVHIKDLLYVAEII